MHSYTLLEWLLLFYLYCFFGWCFESAYVSLLEKKFVNRGFLRAPLLPIYGSGALCILIVCLPVRENAFAVFVLGIIFPTMLEYATGWAMEAMFHMRYWDYTHCFANLNGYICLKSSIAWGVLSLLVVNFIHPPIGRLVEHLPWLAQLIIVLIVSMEFISDFAVAFRAAFNLRHLLEELERIHTQLDTTRIQLELARAEARDRLQELSAEARAEHRRRLGTLEQRREQLLAEFNRHAASGNRYLNRALLRAHPTATSRRFSHALEQFKQNIKK